MRNNFLTPQMAGRVLLGIALIGQLLFAAYVLGFYGPTINGDFALWDRKTELQGGYIEGDLTGNLTFLSHVLLTVVIGITGVIQLIPRIRARYSKVHRWSGRLFLGCGSIAALSGLYLTLVRGTDFGNTPAIIINAVLILIFSALAVRAAWARDFAAHQQWAMRAWIVINGVFFLRIGIMAWAIISQGKGLPAAFEIWTFGSYTVPLVLYELWRKADAGTMPMPASIAFYMVSLLTIVGVVAATALMWLPLL